MVKEQDGLEALSYVSLPGLSWDSAFKMTKARIDLLTDPNMYAFFEHGIRGGMTFVNDHRVKRHPGKQELFYIDAVILQVVKKDFN